VDPAPALYFRDFIQVSHKSYPRARPDAYPSDPITHTRTQTFLKPYLSKNLIVPRHHAGTRHTSWLNHHLSITHTCDPTGYHIPESTRATQQPRSRIELLPTRAWVSARVHSLIIFPHPPYCTSHYRPRPPYHMPQHFPYPPMRIRCPPWVLISLLLITFPSLISVLLFLSCINMRIAL
jgi:hypothetical protein